MEYNKIISVTGLGGLFELVGSKADGAIVRSLEDKTTKFISSRSHQFSHLESIEVFTVRDNVNLVDVFNAIKNSSEKLPDYKDANAVKAYLQKVYPDMDFERVYASDMKKMIRWYGILSANNIDFSLPANEELKAEAEAVAEEKPVEEAEAKPKKKAAPKKKKTEEE
ncbi:hypothetical protein A9P82_01600 [Arachidicoccus ginsenosidimutans]|uniref:DUF5606 family protein n=1 Tax=Arachidicoccus sp. BS20 TaxID=1850526 RepID=UPI0007F1804C|nr:DUF5606 domain-containing protein [Arachidicoccus sp. BS20]ANI88119.1 hypothetical protein A9P82_01600 [Arachidicoccus sp. BS20]